MSSLHELQTRLMDALLGGASAGAGAVSLIGSTEASAASRLRVYRNNVLANFVDALHSSYPVLWRLVGEDYFRQVAREFHRDHPSRSGDLLHAGQCFPDFLAGLHAADEYRYFPEVARLEWLVQEAWLAADHPPLDLAKLSAVAPSAYDTLRFGLHPALRLFASPYPVQRIWEANNRDAEPEPIDLRAGADRLALLRQRLQLRFLPLSRGEERFLQALQRGDSFARAVASGAEDASQAEEDEFDPTAALQRFVAAEAIVSFQ